MKALASAGCVTHWLLPLVLHCAVVCSNATSTWQYGIMVDAGSGGSRLHVYRWGPRVTDPLYPQHAAVTVPEEIGSVQVSPGISRFAKNMTALELYMHELLEKAKYALSDLKEQWSLIPIYLKATAGARDLYQNDRDLLFANVRKILFACPFRFESHYWARTISGEEEGAFAWLALNAIKGTYRDESVTWGALDMGGASTQIAFIPDETSIIQNYVELHLSRYEMHLYAHSYLEFGYRDANERIVRNFLKSSNGVSSGSPFEHPCFPRGHRFIQPLWEPFVKGVRPVEMIGTGDFDACLNLSTRLLNLDARCYVPGYSRDFATDDSYGACAIAGIYEPTLRGRTFAAFGQYAKIAKKIGIPLGAPVALNEWLNRTQAACAADSSIQATVDDIDDPDGINHPGLPNLKDPMGMAISRCWKAVWFYAVLHKGLRFPLHTTQIQFVETFGGKATGWALGAMTHEVNYYPYHSGSLGMNFAEVGAVQANVVDHVMTRPRSCIVAFMLVVVLSISFGFVLGAKITRSRSHASLTTNYWYLQG
eukprot:TRINITY_DN2286_c0_g1_i1.p1 TRINITY_DN2286_c0_g1~~TRINITY_DN2286_c0_g1_i1.p1  ORF type:complete len:537 (+),score=34.99 TRINITY_DN2286_c0_g1_i1:81-1691(+)